MKRFLLCAAIASIAAVSATTVATATPNGRDGDPPGRGGGHDDLEHPLGKEQRARRAVALEQRLQGKGSGKVQQVANGQYVELALEGTDQVFVVLGEFADFAHNSIAEPDRSVDNATIWQDDYDVEHYDDMYFTKMRDFYLRQSSGRYSIDGEVQDWVGVEGDAEDYGANTCGDVVCTNVWDFVQDTANSWYAEMEAAGMSDDEIEAKLQSFDVWDRYDFDGDGDFDESDGYIDHFQIVHSGEGEETGGGALGEDAIWSHRWYTFFNLIGVVGPDGLAPFGGFQIGDSNVWVGDYTIQPENGGLGVFAHEYAHDLGLPDQYDTAGGENGTGFWTIMSSGSYLGDGTDSIGEDPGGFNAWEKFQLGWLNYEVASAGVRSSHKLGPANANTKQAQALFTVLPDRQRLIELGDPPEGDTAWYSDQGDNIDHTMITSSPVTVPAGDPVLRASVLVDIEAGWDYAYAVMRAVGSDTWTNLPGNVTTNSNPNGQNFGNGITGSSGGNWLPAQFDASAFAGQSVEFGFRYWTDGAVVNPGILIDEIALGAFTSGAEGDAASWVLDGFRTTTGTELASTFNAYVAEFRQYRDDDASLRTGPYNFDSYANQNHVEHFPYQDGLLVSYWDAFHTDNNTSLHPGEGLILPVDAHPAPLMRGDGGAWRPRVQMYDATFGLEKTDPISLNYVDFATGGEYPSNHPSLPAVPTFDDTKSWWSVTTAGSGVDVPATGTKITVKSVSSQGSFMQVVVN